MRIYFHPKKLIIILVSSFTYESMKDRNSVGRCIIHGPRPTQPQPNNNVEEVAHEVVVNYHEPTQPNPSYNEVDAVRSVRPKGKRC